MEFKAATPETLFLFQMILSLVVIVITAGVYFASKNLGKPAVRNAVITFCSLLAWMAVTAAVVATGWVEASPWPRLLVFFLGVNLVALGLGFSKFGKLLAFGLPVWALIAFHAFRLPLELVLHEWVDDEVIPGTMSWGGNNVDIFTGALAIVAAVAIRRWPWFAWTFNVVGICLLINVMRVAMMSSPLPFAWEVRIPLQLAFHLPYAWIAPICVASALFGHVVLTRALLKK